MKIIRSVPEAMSYSNNLKRRRKSIGLVPTMGYLHEGHLSLARRATKENDTAIMSIFVNPAQFGPKEDLKKYPRDFKNDERLARSARISAIFYPSSRSMYPDGYKTYVEVENITKMLCGLSRPGHFRGVTTVVSKLFNIIRPDIAYFGQKDAQQAIVIKRMALDLNMGLKVKVLPIVRERDGLAMSSRNVYLSEKERSDARVLYEALDLARKLLKRGLRDPDKIKKRMTGLIETKKSAEIDYISISSIDDLEELKVVKKRALIALAVRIGKTRLIDNIIIGGYL